MSSTAPHSPCINICSIGPEGWCLGCYRTMNEIGGWIRMDATAQWSVIRACDARRGASRTARSGPAGSDSSVF